MSEAVLVALVSGGVALLGSVIASLSNSKLLSYKLDELKRDFSDLCERVNRHNSVVERMATAEMSIKAAHRRIDELREGH